MADYRELQQRHQADLAALLPGMLQRLEWPADRLAAHRRSELQRLVRTAKEFSPWHRKRLSMVDPAQIDETMLSELPVMTKDDVMGHFDEIVTDDRLRLDIVETHLATLTENDDNDAYLFDRYHAITSGGSSGRRGVFVYDWEPWAIGYLSAIRYEARALQLDPQLAAHTQRGAMVAAATDSHGSGALTNTFSSAQIEWRRFPITWPIADIVAGLNDWQPSLLTAYPSALAALAPHARAQRLRIQPRRILAAGEPLHPEIRAAVEDTWKVPVCNSWGMSEGGITGTGCGFSPGLHLNEDIAIIEPVDTAGRPVPTGVRSDKIYLTNLFNHALPLIRYEITDQITLTHDCCPCGSTHRLMKDPQGRLDDCFTYGQITVHPHLFRSQLGHHATIVEYQVRQTPSGADIALRCTAPTDLPALKTDIENHLARLGLPKPHVTLTPVEHLERQSSGKLKRFIPLHT